MEFAILLVVALVPPLALLFVPRGWLPFVSIGAAAIGLLAALWSWKLNETCVSDGCIGAGIMAGFTLVFIVLSVTAGAIRWGIVHYRNRRDGGWGN